MKKTLQKISDNTIRRLPRYLRALCELEVAGLERVSSVALGGMLGATSSQIRQDLNCFGEFGTQGYGYGVGLLKHAIEDILGKNRRYRSVLIGAGNIGRALMENRFFEENGFEPTAVFDVLPERIGTRIGGVRVFDVRDMPRRLSQFPAEVAVLCVPKDAAQSSAEQAVKLGVRAIWNFTNADICIENARVVVENIHFSDSLMTLGYRLRERQDTANAAQQTDRSA